MKKISGFAFIGVLMAIDVLHVSHTDIRSDSRIIKEINCLSEAGYKVTALGVDFDEGGKTAFINKNIELKTISIASNKLRFSRWLPKIFVHVLIVLELTFKFFFLAKSLRPRIIHCHDTLVLPLCALVKFFTKSKLIYDAHELESNKNGTSKIGGRLTLFVERTLWGAVDGFITVSNSILDWYSENVGFKVNAKVILNSPITPSTGCFKDSNYLRERFAIPADKKIFIYVGILGEGRYIEDLVKIFQNASISSHLVFVGYGKLERFLNEVTAYQSNIHLHEAVIHDKLIPIISSADVGLCLLPNVSLSDYYCLPNKFFEYVFSGIPVISSDMPEMSSLISCRNLGVTCELNYESIIDTVVMLENEQVNVDFDFEDIEDLSWNAQVEKLILLYSDIGI